MDTDTVSLEDVVEEEGASLAPSELEEEARQELPEPEAVEELTGLGARQVLKLAAG